MRELLHIPTGTICMFKASTWYTTDVDRFCSFLRVGGPGLDRDIRSLDPKTLIESICDNRYYYRWSSFFSRNNLSQDCYPIEFELIERI